jgi:chitodextrinase
MRALGRSLQVFASLALLSGWCQLASADEPSSGASALLAVLDSSDLTPPSTPANLSWTTDGMTVLLSWQPSTDDSGYVEYALFFGSFYLGAFADTSVAMIGFKAGTPYTFTVKARDAAGNMSVASNSATVLIGTLQDTTPPTAPTNLAAGTVTSSSVALSWTASSDDVGVVVYQVYAGGSSAIATSTSPRATLSNLAADTTYTFTVKALDAAGNVSSASGAVVVRTKTAPDTQAPTAPTNLSSTAQTTSSITLAWSASSDNVGVTAYDVYRGGALAGSVSSTSFDDSGLQPDTAYTYTVQARDAAGNVSAASASLTARTTTAGTGDATIVPASGWACGMSGGIPPPTQGTLVFRATLQLGNTQNVGATQYGQRRVLDVKGGTVTGSRISATVLTGGFDFELTLSNGVVEQEQIDMLRASDGTLIYLRTCGVAPAGSSEVRIVPDFEVSTSSSLAWLNTGKFAGTRTVNASAGTMQLDVYDVSSVSTGSNRIQISKPSGVPAQPWDCSTVTGSKGASVFTETVTLGSSLSVGTTKRGTRNVIPITGGTVSGRLNGTIVPGGADYQLTASGSSTKLDAKYVLASNDGEFVVVRNCGPFGALIPQFETRASGPYSFLNSNNYVSSDPGGATGGVSITFYQRQ